MINGHAIGATERKNPYANTSFLEFMLDSLDPKKVAHINLFKELAQLQKKFSVFAKHKVPEERTKMGWDLFAEHINLLVKHKICVDDEVRKIVHNNMEDILFQMGEKLPYRRTVPQRWLDGGGECYDSDADAAATKFVFNIGKGV